MRWADGPLAVLDTETTGIDPLSDRIVSLTFGWLQALVETAGPDRVDLDFIVNPGIEIPEAASAVHGISTQRAREQGLPPAVALGHLAGALEALSGDGIPLVIFNARFDWPLVHAEAARCGISMPRDILLLDPLVIDRAGDRYRRGSRKLADVAAHYGVLSEEAAGSLHSSGTDALLAGRVVRAMAHRYPDLGEVTLQTLQTLQALWFRGWQEGINAYWARRGKAERVEGTWPWGPGLPAAPSGTEG